MRSNTELSNNEKLCTKSTTRVRKLTLKKNDKKIP